MSTLVFFGNPNTGKTTLYNTLTRSAERASNWHGVTVEERSKTVKVKGKTFVVVDLPGLNSIHVTSPEEQVSVDALLEYRQKPDTMVALVCDAGNLNKNLLLAYELQELCVPFILVLNMINEVKGDKSALQSKLKTEFDTEVVMVDGRKKKSAMSIWDAVEIQLEKRKGSCGNDTKESTINNNLKLEQIEQKVKNNFAKIDRLLQNCNFMTTKTEKANYWLSKPIVAIPVFFVVFGFVFWLSFGPLGTWLSELMERYLVNGLLDYLACAAFESNALLGNFVHTVLVVGIGSVLCFLPQMMLLFLLLSLLEDVGFLARIALVLDAPFRRLGLSGRSVFSLLSGFGCTTGAVLVTRNLESRRVRTRTVLALPFFGCSAKVPVLLLVSTLFFAGKAFMVVGVVYAVSIALCFLILFALTMFEKKQPHAFLMELPRLRLPSVKKVFVDTLSNMRSFLGRTLGMVALLCIVVFFLETFDMHFARVESSGRASILQTISSWFAPVFAPLGFGFYGVVVALIFGLVAKEMLISSLAMVNGVGVGLLAQSLTCPESAVFFTSVSAASFLIFVMLFTPCLPALFMMKREMGAKVAAFCGLFQFALAYVVALFVYQIGSGNLIFIWILIAIAVAFVIAYMIKWRAYRHCKGCGNCYGCKTGIDARGRTHKTF